MINTVFSGIGTLPLKKIQRNVGKCMVLLDYWDYYATPVFVLCVALFYSLLLFFCLFVYLRRKKKNFNKGNL
jgi:hypothetical protein